jgi:hypothetical protein
MLPVADFRPKSPGHVRIATIRGLRTPFARRVASEFCILEKGRCVANGDIAHLTDDVVHAHLSVSTHLVAVAWSKKGR